VQGFPVLHAFVAQENTERLGQVLDFLASAIAADQVLSFLVDKSMSEIAAIRSVFPHDDVRLCSFHCIQAVTRAMNRMRVPSYLSECLTILFRELREASSAEEFEKARERLLQLCPPKLKDNFLSNWLNCCEQWASHCNSNFALDNNKSNGIFLPKNQTVS
jgi:transposase-like protein